MSNYIYLDNAATTPILPEVKNEMLKVLTSDFGNPSSIHKLGLQAERHLKDARDNVARLLNINSDDVIFTSGGTESNNLAIIGTVEAKSRMGRHCITSNIEHPSVLETFYHLENRGYEVTYLKVNREGLINIDELKSSIRPDTILISIGYVNSEIGSVQSVYEIGNYIKNNHENIVFHVDAVQAFGKFEIEAWDMGADLISVSAHKIHGPKGVGALYLRNGSYISPTSFGGNQEFGLRSGTENLPGIVGFGKASEWNLTRIKKNEGKMMSFKKHLTYEIKNLIPETIVNGPELERGSAHILNISIPGIKGNTLLHFLESKNVYVSTGSACTSMDTKISKVQRAIGSNNDLAEAAIRISLSYLNTQKEIDMVPAIIKESVDEVRKFTRR